jgi:transposase
MGKPETRVVDKRMRFVTAVDAGEETVTALCRRFGFSRKTGYKWLERYHDSGVDGLADRRGCRTSTRRWWRWRSPRAAFRCARRIRHGGR